MTDGTSSNAASGASQVAATATSAETQPVGAPAIEQEAAEGSPEGATPEALAQGLEGEAKKAGRHPFYEKLAQKFSDRQFGNDNEMLDVANEHFDELEGKLTRSAESNKIVMDALESEPVLAKIIMDVFKGASAQEALALHMNLDELAPLEGEPDYEKWNENKKTRLKNLEERQTFEKELETNSKASMDEIKAFVKENKMSDQEASEFLETVNNILSDVYKGKVTKDFLNNWKRVLNYKADVEKAHQQGEIKGRNTTIEAVKADETKKGDNLPKILSAATQDKPVEQAKPTNPIEQSIDDFNKRRSVFP